VQERKTVSTSTSSAASSSSTPLAASPITYFLLRRLHSLTSILFGGYLLVHLLINATLIEGTQDGVSVFAQQVQKIHSLPFLVMIEWTFIFIPILFHAIYGIWIALAGQPNSIHYPFAHNLFYLLQRLSTIIIVAFMLVHVLGFKGYLGESLKFDPSPDHAVQSVVNHIKNHPWLLYGLYPIGILASCFHLANGFWCAAITWGLAVSAAAQRQWGYLCIGLFFFSMGSGFIALYALFRM
jgi:succinate dehydrogenase / fumarate reductase, cytochrome b subunit